jgi:hypothetical protein
VKPSTLAASNAATSARLGFNPLAEVVEGAAALDGRRGRVSPFGVH